VGEEEGLAAFNNLLLVCEGAKAACSCHRHCVIINELVACNNNKDNSRFLIFCKVGRSHSWFMEQYYSPAISHPNTRCLGVKTDRYSV
jgi:hypothetical protein